jgi:hypothetical protein
MDFLSNTTDSVFVEGQVAHLWHTLYPDLLLMHNKLKGLGIVRIDGQITYLEEDYHV